MIPDLTFLLVFQAFFRYSQPVAGSLICSPTSLQLPEVFGVDFIDIYAEAVHNHTELSLRPGTSVISNPTISFCNVSVSYTHPGWNDTIHVSVWLPLQQWNERLQALGGGGYSAGFGGLYMAQAVAARYVAIETDAGHSNGIDSAHSPSKWALTSPGNVDLYLLEDFATRSLGEMTVIGKAITKTYYGFPAKYSYFSGCSQGGRQGLEIAQSFPDHYDGILALAPAINLQKFVPAAYWATQVMKNLNYYPPPCEIEAFTRRAINACDALDGVEDGIISEPSLCGFSARDIVGQKFVCKNITLNFTSAGAAVVQAAWSGPQSLSGNIGWFGVSKDASLTGSYLKTQCSDTHTSGCPDGSSSLFTDWFKYFIVKDPSWNASAMTDEQFFEYLKSSEKAYSHLLGSSSPDLTHFNKAGGKIITWHGVADEIIPINGSIAYYNRVLAEDPEAARYYRFFEAPGVGHCFGGSGPIPNDAFSALVHWVEKHDVPDHLEAVPQSGDGEPRPLCPYPLRQKFVLDTMQKDGSFQCVNDTVKQDIGASRQLSFSRQGTGFRV